MKQRFVILAFIAVMAVALCVPAAFAQSGGTARGVCTDDDGKPIVGATVLWFNADAGTKRELKTNKKGEYFSLGMPMGKYKVSLIVKNADGTDKELSSFNNVPVGSGDERVVDFDMKKEHEIAAKGGGMSAEAAKKLLEQQANQKKEAETVKSLNDKLMAANDAMKANHYDTAIQTLTEATQIDSTRDLIWFKLGEAYRGSASEQTDSAEKTKRYDQAIEAYNKAITIKPSGAYYNNLADAYAKVGKTKDAVAIYNQAIQTDPTGAGQYYYNLGAILTNANTSNNAEMRDAAIAAFDKAIAADPARADSYYWKATNLMGAATIKGDKMVAPPGTAEAFTKYLELKPDGSHAEEAKQMLAAMGSTIETHFGKGKGPRK